MPFLFQFEIRTAMYLAVLLLLLSPISLCQSLEVLPNIGYLLRGYHLYHGNPLPTQVTADPGFLSLIFEHTYKLNLVSADNKYSVPDGTKSNAKGGCTQSFNHEILQTSEEYRRLLRDMVTTNYTGFEHSFKGSSDYQRTHEAHSKDQSTELLLTQLVCLKNEALIDTVNPPLYSSDFLSSLRGIIGADQRNKSDIESINLLIHKVLNTYGTHFVRKIEFGSRFHFQNSFTSLDRYNLEQAGVDMRTGAVLSMTKKMGHTLSEEELKHSQIFDQLIAGRKSSSSSTYSKDGLLDVLNSTPIPLYYEIDRLDSIFVKNMMKTANLNYKRLKALFSAYFINYCENEKAFNAGLDQCAAEESNASSSPGSSLNNFKTVFESSSILWRRKLPEMTAITISWWMKTTPYAPKDSKHRHIVSYNHNNIDHFAILAATERDRGCLKIKIDGEIISDTSQCLIPFDGNYHHYVVVWASIYGRWQVYVDGNIVAGGSANRRYIIPDGGYLVIGQKHASGNLSMDPITMFRGEIAYLNVWDMTVNGVEARNLAMGNGRVQGNIVQWDQSKLQFNDVDVRAVTSNDEFLRI